MDKINGRTNAKAWFYRYFDKVKGHEQKKCFYCGSDKVQKYGHVNGVQRYRCWCCGKQFLGGKHIDTATIWREYSELKQTYGQLAEKYGCSPRTIKRKLDAYIPPKGMSSPGRAVVVMDTTYWGRKYGVVLFKIPTRSPSWGCLTNGVRNGTATLRRGQPIPKQAKVITPTKGCAAHTWASSGTCRCCSPGTTTSKWGSPTRPTSSTGTSPISSGCSAITTEWHGNVAKSSSLGFLRHQEANPNNKRPPHRAALSLVFCSSTIPWGVAPQQSSSSLHRRCKIKNYFPYGIISDEIRPLILSIREHVR